MFSIGPLIPASIRKNLLVKSWFQVNEGMPSESALKIPVQPQDAFSKSQPVFSARPRGREMPSVRSTAPPRSESSERARLKRFTAAEERKRIAAATEKSDKKQPKAPSKSQQNQPAAAARKDTTPKKPELTAAEIEKAKKREEAAAEKKRKKQERLDAERLQREKRAKAAAEKKLKKEELAKYKNSFAGKNSISQKRGGESLNEIYDLMKAHPEQYIVSINSDRTSSNTSPRTEIVLLNEEDSMPKCSVYINSNKLPNYLRKLNTTRSTTLSSEFYRNGSKTVPATPEETTERLLAWFKGKKHYDDPRPQELVNDLAGQFPFLDEDRYSPSSGYYSFFEIIDGQFLETRVPSSSPTSPYDLFGNNNRRSGRHPQIGSGRRVFRRETGPDGRVSLVIRTGRHY